MSRKVFVDEGNHREMLDKNILHAEHPTDIKPKIAAIKHHKPLMPRNPNTHVSIRLPQDLCDWLWGLYPDEPTISSAVQRYMKEQYGIRTKAGSI